MSGQGWHNRSPHPSGRVLLQSISRFLYLPKPALVLLRDMGLRLIAYIDDILVLAESKEIARSQVEGLVHLL